jgi:hypothetical protein
MTLKEQIFEIFKNNPNEKYHADQFKYLAQNPLDIIKVMRDLLIEKKIIAQYTIYSRANPNHLLVEVDDFSDIVETYEDIDEKEFEPSMVEIKVVWSYYNSLN